ncbi:MAG: hypothetical protein AAGL68_01855 [Pseudomonadota bacterium]
MDRTTTYFPGSPGDPLELALTRELRRGEHVTWRGRQIGRLSGKSFGIYLFAIPWTAFALFWTTMASFGASEITSGGIGLLAWAFPLFGVPFILIGLVMLGAPFLPWIQRGKVIYAVTDQRVLRIEVGRKLTIKSLPAREIGMIKRDERRDRTGSLKVAIGITTDSDGDKSVEYFDIGEVEDILGAHDAIAELGASAA